MFLYRLVSGYCFRILDGRQLEPEELDFLKWYAVHSNIMSEEFGRRINPNIIIDPEMEFRRFKQIMARNERNPN